MVVAEAMDKCAGHGVGHAVLLPGQQPGGLLPRGAVVPQPHQTAGQAGPQLCGVRGQAQRPPVAVQPRPVAAQLHRLLGLQLQTLHLARPGPQQLRLLPTLQSGCPDSETF